MDRFRLGFVGTFVSFQEWRVLVMLDPAYNKLEYWRDRFFGYLGRLAR